MLAAFSGSMSSGLTTTFRGFLANSYQIPVDGRGLISLTARVEREVLAAIALPLGVLVLAAISGNVIQHRLVWSADSLKPKFSKVSPLAGLKRLFSRQAIANFVKGPIKLTVLGAGTPAHDGRGAEGLRHHHQPDPLRHRPAIRPRHERPGLPRQGHRSGGVENPRAGSQAFHPDRGKSAARPRAACHRRDRRGNPDRALQGGGRNHRLRHETPPRRRAGADLTG